MPNIVITERCNLHCSYCFANDIMGKSAKEMTISNFNFVLDFINKNKNKSHLGIIGGEPCIHSKFKEILQILINNDQVEDVTLFTNGIMVDGFFKELSHKKFKLLINVNSPEDIGTKNFEKLCANIEMMIEQYYMRDKINLGINLYSENFEYAYFLQLLKKYKLKEARFSISVPNTSQWRNTDAHPYFIKMKPRLKRFFSDLLKEDIHPFYDCNRMPECLMTDEDYREFLPEKYLPKEKSVTELIQDNVLNIVSDWNLCGVGIDILPDLTARRCFALSEYTKVNITDFQNINDIHSYYINEIDSFACTSTYNIKCADCYRRKTSHCWGGCLVYKINNIMQIKKYCETNMRDSKRKNFSCVCAE